MNRAGQPSLGNTSVPPALFVSEWNGRSPAGKRAVRPRSHSGFRSYGNIAGWALVDKLRAKRAHPSSKGPNAGGHGAPKPGLPDFGSQCAEIANSRFRLRLAHPTKHRRVGNGGPGASSGRGAIPRRCPRGPPVRTANRGEARQRGQRGSPPCRIFTAAAALPPTSSFSREHGRKCNYLV